MRRRLVRQIPGRRQARQRSSGRALSGPVCCSERATGRNQVAGHNRQNWGSESDHLSSPASRTACEHARPRSRPHSGQRSKRLKRSGKIARVRHQSTRRSTSFRQYGASIRNDRRAGFHRNRVDSGRMKALGRGIGAGLVKPRVAKVCVRAAVNRNLYPQSIIGRR